MFSACSVVDSEKYKGVLLFPALSLESPSPFVFADFYSTAFLVPTLCHRMLYSMV